MADGRCLWRLEILQIEGLGFFEPLWPTVVAPGASKSSTNVDIGFFRSLWPTVVAFGGSKSSKNEGLGFVSL